MMTYIISNSDQETGNKYTSTNNGYSVDKHYARLSTDSY